MTYKNNVPARNTKERELVRPFIRGTTTSPIVSKDYKRDENGREYVDVAFYRDNGTEVPAIRVHLGYERKEALEVAGADRKKRPVSLDRTTGILYFDSYTDRPLPEAVVADRISKGYKPRIVATANGRVPGLVEWVTGERNSEGFMTKDLLTDVNYALSVFSREGQYKYLNRVNDYIGRIDDKGSTRVLESGLSKLEQSVETIKGWLDDGVKKDGKVIIRGRNGKAFIAFNIEDLKESYDMARKKANRLWNELDSRRNIRETNKEHNKQVMVEIEEEIDKKKYLTSIAGQVEGISMMKVEADYNEAWNLYREVEKQESMKPKKGIINRIINRVRKKNDDRKSFWGSFEKAIRAEMIAREYREDIIETKRKRVEPARTPKANTADIRGSVEEAIRLFEENKRREALGESQ